VDLHLRKREILKGLKIVHAKLRAGSLGRTRGQQLNGDLMLPMTMVIEGRDDR
jgi:hypothetical protein